MLPTLNAHAPDKGRKSHYVNPLESICATKTSART